MFDDDHRQIALEARIKHLLRVEDVVKLVALFVLLAMVAFQSVLLWSANHRDAQNTCIVKLEAAFERAVGDALAAPPAPSTLRLSNVSKIRKAAAALHGFEETCPA